MHRSPSDLLLHLREQKITHLEHIVDENNTSFLQLAWKTDIQLNIPPPWQQHWRNYIQALLEAHIRWTRGDDEIIWALAKSGRYTPKEGYIVLVEPRKPPILHKLWKHLWKLKAPPRSKLLMWCILRNRIPTGDNLMKRSFFGPHWCHFCNKEGETASHIFLNYPIICHLWNLVSSAIPSIYSWHPG